jgi:catechol 2,3-dioxygenase-like lactoylglutathione lyase family enzyme
MDANDFSSVTGASYDEHRASKTFLTDMNIIGPDELVFGVDDVQACKQYLLDYGLRPTAVTDAGWRFEALDGTAIVVRRASDPSLPPWQGAAPALRETTYGVADEATLRAIATELSKDREVGRAADGSLTCVDDMGFALRFKLTERRPFEAPADLTNAPGSPPQRAVNRLGITPDMPAIPRTLSHVVLFVPDAAKAEAFYHRLGFRTTDRFTNAGPFMRPAGTQEHHTLFMIQTPPFMKGVEHFTFHVGSGTEVLVAGTRFEAKGYTTFWGPGRHLLGSNWFWYFNSPLGCHVEYDADMDLHDDSWVAREVPSNADTSQLFLFTRRDKWFPSGGPK